MGNIEETFAETLGTGARFAKEYLLKQGKIISARLSINEGIKKGFESLYASYQDIYTSGCDLIVLTKKRIEEFGKDIRDCAESVEKKAIERIRQKYK